MIFSFAEALAQLGPNAAARIANGTRPPGSLLFSTILPERLQPDYHVDAANMTVRSTMAGLVGMDSPYPPGGSVEMSTFFEQSAKIAIENTLTEGAIRQLQTLMRQFQVDGTLTNDFLATEALNFFQKIIVQALMDTSEWMRGQALVYGAINWVYNQKTLAVDYGFPAAHFLTTRTDANGDAYGDTSSGFWADVIAAQELLRYNVRAVIMNSRTMYQIINNAANALEIISVDNAMFEVVRLVNRGGTQVRDSDARYRMKFLIYDEEAEVLDTTAATLGRTQHVKFMPDGKVLFLAANTASGYRVGQGSTDDPKNDLELGYTHLAPTVEGNGAPGRWGRMFTPEGFPMHLKAQGVSNELPIILANEKVVVATTEIM